MRKIRYFINVTKLFIRRFALLIILGVVFGGLFFVFNDKIPPLLLGLKREEKIGVLGRFTQETLPVTISVKLSSGLSSLDDENRPIPAIAQSWETQENGRVWIFKLRPNLKWQDNTPVRANNFSYNFPGIAISYPDFETIKFTLEDPYVPFPVLVSRPYFKKGLLGVGEWHVKRIVQSSGFVKELTLSQKISTIKSETYKFYENEDKLISAFKLGEIDTILEISDTQKLPDWPNVKLEKTQHLDRYIGIFLNTDDPLLSEKSIRQALAYAIKKQNYGDKIYNGRALSSISPLSWTYNPLVKTYDYNQTRAKELLKGIPQDQKKNLKINLVTIPSLLTLAEQIKKDWEEVGIKTEVQVGTGVPEKFQGLLATQIIPPDPDQYSMWHSIQDKTNITKFKNPRIDKLLEDGRVTLNEEERKKIYLDFQRFLVEESPVIFLYHPVSYKISRK